jgi:predicted membrane channel-forming protein YqfA (hemolysin III family)
VALLSWMLVPKKSGHTCVKLIMAFQFVGLLGYLCRLAQTSLPISCAKYTSIFWVYAPGLILYVLKQPKNDYFGFHEFFHTSVLAGHVSSMLFDLWDIAAPCSR